jgi:hypothetical protein
VGGRQPAARYKDDAVRFVAALSVTVSAIGNHATDPEERNSGGVGFAERNSRRCATAMGTRRVKRRRWGVLQKLFNFAP